MPKNHTLLLVASLSLVTTAFASPLLASPQAPRSEQRPEFPPFSEVSKNFTAVKSTEDGETPLYRLWVNNKTQQVLAELPRDYAKRNVFIGWTISGGRPNAGVQTGDLYARWKRFGKSLALVEPNFAVRTTGDRESRAGNLHYVQRRRGHRRGNGQIALQLRGHG